MLNSSIESFLNKNKLDTPCLVIDLSLVNYFYNLFEETLSNSKIFYAVKANSAIEIIKFLKDIGSYFDVSSKKEIEICLDQNISPSLMSYGNTIKKSKDILWAYKKGLRLFAFDSLEELKKLSDNANGSKVYCRLQVNNQGAHWPLSKKFGCSVDEAKEMMLEAKKLGLIPAGISFHVGSQQTKVIRWQDALKSCNELSKFLKENNIEIEFINIGGGFPVSYKDFKGNLEVFLKDLNNSILNIFGNNGPKIFLEPGRALVGEAGIIETEVILVTQKENRKKRWVYIDIGRFGGLAETENEAIKYNIVCPGKIHTDYGLSVIAGPTCDGADILYEKYDYLLPLNLEIGDRLRIYGTGAYTSVYSSNFNSMEKIKEYFINSK